MTVSKRTRYEVFRRDNHTCRYCGATAPDATLTIDHVTPVALGGSDSPDNLVAACDECNYGKASSNPGAELIDDVKQADIKWAAAMKEAAKVRMAEQAKLREYVDAFDEVWGYRTPEDYRTALENFYAAGLPEFEMIDAAYVATCAKYVDNRFRYFCGVAWRKVNDLQEIAKSLLTVDEAEGD